MDIDDIRLKLPCLGELTELVRFAPVIITVAVLDASVNKFEWSKEQLEVKVEFIPLSQMPLTRESLDSGSITARADVNPTLTTVAPRDRFDNAAEFIINIDKRLLIVLVLEHKADATVNITDPQHVLVFGDIPFPMVVIFWTQATLEAKTHGVGGTVGTNRQHKAYILDINTLTGFDSDIVVHPTVKLYNRFVGDNQPLRLIGPGP